MLVPTPRKTKEMIKMAASRMETNLTQKPNLSRFIIMARYPPRYSGTQAIVYHVAPDDRDGHGPARRSLQNLPLRTLVPQRELDQREVGPVAGFQASRLVLDPEGTRPAQRRELQARRAVQAMKVHREQRLLEDGHAGAAPEPVGAHPDPDAPLDHTRHRRNAAAEVIVGARTMRGRNAGPRQDVYLFFRDAGGEVGRDRPGAEKPHVAGVANGRYPHPSPLVTSEDVGEAARAVPYELHLLGALGEVYRQLPPQVPRSLRRQARGLGIYGVGGMHADRDATALRQALPKLVRLPHDELHRLLRRADLVRKELGEDGSGHAARGELRQAFPVGRRLGHVGSPRLYGLPGRVAGGLCAPALLLREAFYKLAQPARERATLGLVLPPETEVGVGVDGTGDQGVAGKETDLDVGVLTPDLGERPNRTYATVLHEHGAVPYGRRRDGHEGSGREDYGLALRHPSRPPPRPRTAGTRAPGRRAGGQGP